MKKVTFCKLKSSLSRNFFTIYKKFGDIVECIFTILLQTPHENNFLPNSKHPKAKGCRFLGIVRMLHLSHKFRLPKMSSNETPHSWLQSQSSE